MIRAMDLNEVFAGLDQRPWAEWSHAYGSAADTPVSLRALAAADEGVAEQAEQDLWSSLVHQGSVYEATVHAVPFLARLVAADVRREALLGMLGSVAESTDERGVATPGAPRAAVLAALPLLLPLLDDGDPAIRQCAAWAIAQCRPGAQAQAALRQRWSTESDPEVRADLLSSLALADPKVALPLAAAALAAHEPAPVRVAAVLAHLDSGGSWHAGLTEAVTHLLPLGDQARGSVWNREPLHDIVEKLCEAADGTEAAIVLVDTVLRATPPRGHERRAAIASEAGWAAAELVRNSRSAPARLLPAMLPLLDDPETAGCAIDAVGTWGVPVPEAIPALVRLTAEEGHLGDRALAALVRLGAPQAPGLLAANLPRRPRALGAAVGFPSGHPVTPLPCAPALLHAVRQRLADPRLTGNEPIHLASLLASWGRAAGEALPELLAALPRHPDAVPRALAAVADEHQQPQAVAALREAARAEAGGGRQAVATALYRLTGDPAPLLGVLAEGLKQQGNMRPHLVRALADLGGEAQPLLPDLLALLREPAEARRTTPMLDAALEAAALVWELTPDQDAVLPLVLPIVREGLALGSQSFGWWTAVRAARTAALLGPAALPVSEQLVRLLDQPTQGFAAAQALLALYPDTDTPAGLRLTDLVDRVLDVAEGAYGAPFALAALEDPARFRRAALTAAQRQRLRAIAEDDRRVIRSGIEDRIVIEDEKLRDAARTALRTLTTGALA